MDIARGLEYAHGEKVGHFDLVCCSLAVRVGLQMMAMLSSIVQFVLAVQHSVAHMCRNCAKGAWQACSHVIMKQRDFTSFNIIAGGDCRSLQTSCWVRCRMKKLA